MLTSLSKILTTDGTSLKPSHVYIIVSRIFGEPESVYIILQLLSFWDPKCDTSGKQQSCENHSYPAMMLGGVAENLTPEVLFIT